MKKIRRPSKKGPKKANKAAAKKSPIKRREVADKKTEKVAIKKSSAITKKKFKKSKSKKAFIKKSPHVKKKNGGVIKIRVRKVEKIIIGKETKEISQKRRLVTRKDKAKVFFLVAIFILFFLLWGPENAIAWIAFIAFLIYGWIYEIVAFFAFFVLISLAFCPILLFFKKEALIDQTTLYAYFFLIMTLVLQIIEVKLGDYLKKKKIW